MSRTRTYLFVALLMGLGWALRGHFGHEYGAAWAGALGGLAVVAAARRPDWASRMPVLAALGAVGWAVGGIMSYGRIVGFTRGTDFGNVLYGFGMLAVVGGLYGFIGGGLLGFGLETTKERRPDWPALITQMTVGGWLAWGLLIYQFEWNMTPPRSELWAGCLGASLALAWYAYRHGFLRTLRLAGYTALGAGFGFAFGDFLQIMGNLTGWSFNWWNLMEFTLGFCGGLGLVYGVISGEWPETAPAARKANWTGLAFLLIVIPVLNILQGMEYSSFLEMATRIGRQAPGLFATLQIVSSWVLVVVVAIPGFMIWRRLQDDPALLARRYLPGFLFGYGLLYILFSHLKKGFFYTPGQLEHYFYWLILLGAIWIWFGSLVKPRQGWYPAAGPESWKKWGKILGLVILVLIALTLISISSHAGLPGMQTRF